MSSTNTNTFVPLFFFIMITIGYYFMKPSPTINTLEKSEESISYSSTNHMFMICYFVLVVFVQFGINCSLIISKCGGSIGQNIAAAGLMTFIPWVFIFGMVMVILVLFPGFKSAFSNVIGYFVVSSGANKILTELLINTDITKAIQHDSSASPEKKEELQSAADAIIRLCGNMSILINQIVPTNFQEYWNILKPLMKPKYQTETKELDDLKQQLLNIVVRRDNVGEALWYIYTAVLLISITQYSIMSRPCTQDVNAMKATNSTFQTSQSTLNAQNAKATSTTYTVS